MKFFLMIFIFAGSLGVSFSQTVYASKATNIYHYRKNCSFLKGEYQTLTKTEAERNGFSECGVCDPPREALNKKKDKSIRTKKSSVSTEDKPVQKKKSETSTSPSSGKDKDNSGTGGEKSGFKSRSKRR